MLKDEFLDELINTLTKPDLDTDVKNVDELLGVDLKDITDSQLEELEVLVQIEQLRRDF